MLNKPFTNKSIFLGSVVGSDNTDSTTTESTTESINPPIEELPVPTSEVAKLVDQKTSEAEAKLLKEVMQRKAKNKELEDELAGVKTKLSLFDGIDLEEVKTLLNDKQNAEIKKLEEKGQWDTLKEQMKQENAKLLAEQATKAAELKSLIEKQQEMIDKLTLGNSFNTSNFILNELNLSPEKAKIIYGQNFELNGDKVVAYDKPKSDPNRVPLVNADGDFLSFEDAIKKIIDADPDKNILMRSKAKQGAGSNTLPANAKVEQQKTKLTGMARIQSALNIESK